MAIEVIRTFHPVGQGAFYSEEFKDGGETKFIAVYDCGTKTRKEFGSNKNFSIINYVKKWLWEGETKRPVDVLFISHFHDDHISQITVNELEPKKIYMPFLTNRQLLTAALSTPDFSLNAYMHIEQEFEGRIVRVRPASEEEEPMREFMDIDRIPPDAKNPNEPDNRNNGRDIQDEISSGSSIVVCASKTPIWEYLMYNPNWNVYKKKIEDLIDEAVANKILDRTLLNDKANGKYVKDKLKDINDYIYHKLRKGKSSLSNPNPEMNEHSMQVYAGAIGKIVGNITLPTCTSAEILVLYKNRGLTEVISVGSYPYAWHEVESGCLYTGDIIVKRNKKKTKGWWEAYMTCLGNKRWKNVATVQIPHHGSLKNSKDLTQPLKVKKKDTPDLYCVMCFGVPNGHYHPSPILVDHLRNKDQQILVEVTQDPNSILQQRFIL